MTGGGTVGALPGKTQGASNLLPVTVNPIGGFAWQVKPENPSLWMTIAPRIRHCCLGCGGRSCPLPDATIPT